MAASGAASAGCLPDDLPGQSNQSSPSTFSLFSVGGTSTPSPVSPQPAAFATASPTSFESWQSSTVARWGSMVLASALCIQHLRAGAPAPVTWPCYLVAGLSGRDILPCYMLLSMLKVHDCCSGRVPLHCCRQGLLSFQAGQRPGCCTCLHFWLKLAETQTAALQACSRAAVAPVTGQAAPAAPARLHERSCVRGHDDGLRTQRAI